MKKRDKIIVHDHEKPRPFVAEIRVDVFNMHRSDQGIHLIDPVEAEIDDAKQTAERDLFEVIWCHYSNVVDLAQARLIKSQKEREAS